MLEKELTQKDLEFFQEVSTLIYAKYPEMKDKFGIWRIHQHFELEQDEVFHETSNPKTRESTLRIIKKNELPLGAFASTWRLTPQGPAIATWCCDDSPVNHPGN